MAPEGEDLAMELAAEAGAHSSVHSARRLELNVVLGLSSADEQRTSLRSSCSMGGLVLQGRTGLG